jgi:hypothetical protein
VTDPAPIRLKNRLARLRAGYGRDIGTPAARFLSRIHYELADHAILRRWWTNFAPVAPGVYRANHPDARHLARYKAMGIRTILSLRGQARNSPQLFEAEACAALGLILVSTELYARKPASRAALLKLLDLFRTIDKPFLIHCKSGADRAGLAAALYLIVIEGKSVAEARAQLSFRFLHIRASATGVLDHILDVYEARHLQTGIGCEDWIATEYDPAVIMASYVAGRGR